ncbi:uncharacterized protein [Branchiostoma lanceolatum]|uniref:uncharacterized protein isoform X2 n=1 Tax=Branchiostoma lanceolatum TaxID=7740 RepID=UPI003456532D
MPRRLSSTNSSLLLRMSWCVTSDERQCTASVLPCTSAAADAVENHHQAGARTKASKTKPKSKRSATATATLQAEVEWADCHRFIICHQSAHSTSAWRVATAAVGKAPAEPTEVAGNSEATRPSVASEERPATTATGNPKVIRPRIADDGNPGRAAAEGATADQAPDQVQDEQQPVPPENMLGM